MVCWAPDTVGRPALRLPFSPGGKLASDIVAGFGTIAERLTLCVLCLKISKRAWVGPRGAHELGAELLARRARAGYVTRATVDGALVNYIHTMSVLYLMNTVVRGLRGGVFTSSFLALNAIMNAYPRSPERPLAELVRDLGDGVIGIFSVLGNTLIFDDLISLDRCKGAAGRAMREVCAIADRYGVPIVGVIEPHAWNGIAPGRSFEHLAAWYRRVGFQPIDPSEPSAIRREPKVDESALPRVTGGGTGL